MVGQVVEGLRPRAVGIIAGFRVMTAGSDLCMEKLTQLLEENGLDEGQPGCQETNYEAVVVSRPETPACPQVLVVEMMRTK